MASNIIVEDIKAQIKSGNTVVYLILINAAVFLFFSLLKIIASLGLGAVVYDFFHSLFAFPIHPFTFITKPWTIITYMFVHFDIFHLFWNMVTLYWFGKILADYTSLNKIVPLYLLGGIAGALFTLAVFTLFTSPGTSYLIGASAGVTAIIVAAATIVPQVKINLMFVGPVKLIYVALFVIFIDMMNVASQNNIGGSLAHLGGAVMGYVFSVQYKKGNDWSVSINKLLSAIASFFKRTQKGNLKTVYRRTVSDEDYNANKVATQKRIDAILDKIAKSGYDSLSSKEKEFLFQNSKK